eukprot:885390_1
MKTDIDILKNRQRVSDVNTLFECFDWLQVTSYYPQTHPQRLCGILYCVDCVESVDTLSKYSQSFSSGYWVQMDARGQQLYSLTAACKAHNNCKTHQNKQTKVSETKHATEIILKFGYTNIVFGLSDSVFEKRMQLLSQLDIPMGGIGQRHHSRMAIGVMKYIFYDVIQKKVKKAFTEPNHATGLPPFFGSSQDGISEGKTCMEIILTRLLIKGVQRVVPIRVDHIKWKDYLDSGTGKSRVYALQKALQMDLGLSASHISCFYMGSCWDGKYFGLHCD